MKLATFLRFFRQLKGKKPVNIDAIQSMGLLAVKLGQIFALRPDLIRTGTVHRTPATLQQGCHNSRRELPSPAEEVCTRGDSWIILSSLNPFPLLQRASGKSIGPNSRTAAKWW
jgi:hypothetical protein